MLTTVVFVLFLRTTFPYVCQHQSPSPDTLQTGFSSGPLSSPVKYQVTWYKTDKNVSISDSTLDRISDFMSENILVKQASSAIHLSRNCPLSYTNEQTSVQTNPQTDTHYCTEECAQVTKCGPATVPDEHLGRCYVCVDDSKRCGFTVGSTLGQGITGHIVVYLSSRSGESCQGDPVQAATCQVSPMHKRPIAGYISICAEHRIPQEDLPNVLTHQLLHIMGLSENLIDLGEASLEGFSTKWGLIRDDSYDIQDKQFVGAKSKDFVRRHFKCNKDYGVLLENQDPWNSHVEERLYRGEITTVNVTKHSKFSDLTFSLLEDTGWYMAGKTQQPPFPGNLGCDILDRSCNLWVSQQEAEHENPFPFCGISSQDFTCTADHKAVSKCQRKVHSVGAVSAKFQYHGIAGNGYIAGPYKYSDFCMLFSEHEESYSCTDTPPQGRNIFLEKHGENSACVIHDGEWDVSGAGRSKGAGCYSICCRDSNFDVVDVNNTPHSCYQPKQTIHISSSNNQIRGSLQCPSWETACGGGTRVKCQTAGKCMTPSLSNGQVYSSQGMYQVTIGTTLSYVCFDGYVMRGSSSSVCLGNNLFSSPVPQCKLPCQDPLIEFGSVEKSSGGQSLVGDSVTVTCNRDYKLKGSSILTCIERSPGSQRSGSWSPEPPTCNKEYLEWSAWGPCSVTCGDNPGERIRTRGCSTCADFEYEKEVCFANSTCQKEETAVSPQGPNNTVILVAVFAVFFVFTILIIVFIIWFFNKSQQERSQSQLFNESYYWSQQHLPGMKPRERSMDLSSEYSVASGSVKQLFTSPPSTPYTTETKLSSKDSEESLFGSGKSFHIPKIRYKNRARVFPKKPTLNPNPPSYQDSLDMPVFSPDQEDQVEQLSPDMAALRASIQAARARVRNHPSVKRLVMPNPVTGGSYNPNQIPFEISEKEEENYLEDSWDFRNRQNGFKRTFGFTPNAEMKVQVEDEGEEDAKIEELEEAANSDEASLPESDDSKGQN